MTYTTAASTHTVSVSVPGTAYLLFDAFIVGELPTSVGAGTYEDTSAALAFSGSCTTWAHPRPSSTLFPYTTLFRSSVGLTYSGSALTLVYVKQSNTGVATVTIDGTV